MLCENNIVVLDRSFILVFESAKVTKLELILSYTRLLGQISDIIPKYQVKYRLSDQKSVEYRSKIGRRTDIPVSAINQADMR